MVYMLGFVEVPLLGYVRLVVVVDSVSCVDVGDDGGDVVGVEVVVVVVGCDEDDGVGGMVLVVSFETAAVVVVDMLIQLIENVLGESVVAGLVDDQIELVPFKKIKI